MDHSPSQSTLLPAVDMRGITKRFPGVMANQQVGFVVQAGEIHALLGENGAGKTTLMNILCGLYEPDEGEIWLRGQSVRFQRPADAIAAGIGMVYQHFMLVERFTVAENIALGQTGRGWRDDSRALHQRLRALSAHYGLGIDPTAPVWQLSVGERQRVEILKALDRQVDVLILDEPTAVLTPQETEGLMTILRDLAAQGTAIIFISHKLNEVLALCDRVTVLRDGQRVGSVEVANCDAHHLTELMVGREVNLDRPDRVVVEVADRSPLLSLEQVSTVGHHRLPVLQDINLQVYPGEIVGIAGVDGNGQRELEEAIIGLRSLTQGQIHRNGTLAHIPSDRYSMGLIPEFSVTENLLLRDIDRFPFSQKGFLRPAQMVKQAIALVQQYLIRTPSVHTPSGTLSGGNAQKVIIARELYRNHPVILAAQLTRGLDVGAMEYVHAQLMAQRDAGAAILLISTELDEILRLCDRIAVLYEGQIVGLIDAATADVNHLGLLMAGKTQVTDDPMMSEKRSLQTS
ncbi:ABC transporter ATP-binding protein [Oculatella sp. FACHB-28]|uniref:ABC transporter ATP-binding protein n=1 Tax=Oculatella sp. FACHB-28 TaxID=2692845 RepID=UPI001F5512F2|nr:ABC transporter ATP-binding protein [Oculatella sp. FACHB-28]